jgi:hypothetical protein
MPCRHLSRSQAHPTQVPTERLCVGVWLRGTGPGHIITLHEAMAVAALGTPSPGCMSPARMVVPAQGSPRLGELMVVVNWVPGREKDHVVAVAKGHELQAPKPDHRSERKWMFGVCHPRNGRKTILTRSGPLPDAPTIGVQTREGPKPTSEFVLRVPYSEW